MNYGSCSSVSSERDLVSSEPGLLDGRSLVACLDSSGLHTSVLLTSSSDTSVLSVLLVGASDPVDSGVSSDCLVVGVNEDDFVELEGSVLTDPV